MPEVVEQKCPNCSGVLPPLGSAEQVKCQYCGFSFDVKRTVAQPAVERPAPVTTPSPAMRPYRPASMPMPATPQARPANAAGCIAVLGVLIAAAAGAGVVFMRSPGGALSSIVEPSYTFDEMVGFFQVNADGIEDVAMIVRTVQGGDDLHLVMFDGATGHELWQAGDLGSYSQGYQYSHVAVGAGRVLLTDFRGQARLLDLATGAPIAVLSLPDRAKSLCAGASPTEVRLTLQNGSPIVVDLARGTAGPPAVIDLGAGDACPRPPDQSIPQPGAEGPEVTLAGLEGARILTENDVRVAVGRRASGVRVPLAMGLAPDGRTPTWTVLVPTVPETAVAESGSDTLRFGLGGGRLYCAYALHGDAGARITALDARTGMRLWDTAYSGWASSVDVDALWVGPTRLVVEQFGEAELFDARTGALLRRVAPR